MLSERQVKSQIFWTNGCYRHALLEHYGWSLSKKEKRLKVREMRCAILEKTKKVELDSEVHTIYMRNVLAMTSERLAIIVYAFQTGQQYRKQETIDAIMTELFERSANSETKEEYES
jgi:hypothetical protein